MEPGLQGLRGCEDVLVRAVRGTGMLLTASLATPGPPSCLQTTPESPVLLSEVQSEVLHLLGLIRGVQRGGKEDPHFVLGG